MKLLISKKLELRYLILGNRRFFMFSTSPNLRENTVEHLQTGFDMWKNDRKVIEFFFDPEIDVCGIVKKFKDKGLSIVRTPEDYIKTIKTGEINPLTCSSDDIQRSREEKFFIRYNKEDVETIVETIKELSPTFKTSYVIGPTTRIIK